RWGGGARQPSGQPGVVSGTVLPTVPRAPVGYGVIGSPTDSGSVSSGSSPGTPAVTAPERAGSVSRPGVGAGGTRAGVVAAAPSSSGLGRRPLKAVAGVRIPSGLRKR